MRRIDAIHLVTIGRLLTLRLAAMVAGCFQPEKEPASRSKLKATFTAWPIRYKPTGAFPCCIAVTLWRRRVTLSIAIDS
jgi:hypothetical protein